MQMDQTLKSSYKGSLMKLYQLSAEGRDNKLYKLYHPPEQAVQNNDAKLGNSTEIVNMSAFYSCLEEIMSVFHYQRCMLTLHTKSSTVHFEGFECQNRHQWEG